MKESKTLVRQSINVGVITDQTGVLSFLGIANANVAKMVINDINEKGGLLGRGAADKAAIQRVKVPSCQLPDSGM